MRCVDHTTVAVLRGADVQALRNGNNRTKLFRRVAFLRTLPLLFEWGPARIAGLAALLEEKTLGVGEVSDGLAILCAELIPLARAGAGVPRRCAAERVLPVGRRARAVC